MRSSVRGRNQFAWQVVLLAGVVAFLVAFKELGIGPALAIFIGASLGVRLAFGKRRPR
jgi:hypothetical protein